MKKLLALVVLLTVCLSGFAACSKEEENPTGGVTAESNLTTAKNYLNAMYKDSTVATPSDYTVVGVVNIGGVLFPVTWTVEGTDTIKIVPGSDKMVTIDVDEANPEEVSYTLVATITDETGATEKLSFAHRVPAAIIIDEGMSYAEIVDAAYALEQDTSLEGTYRLFGTITMINTAYSPDYQNITVTITVAGKEDKPIQCYRLKGDGAESLAVGDAITVEGTFKNYKGTIEYDAGCILVGMGEQKDYTALLDAAYSLEEGLAMTDACTMTGVISKIDTPYSADYQNITVTIVVNGDEARPIQCYRLKGEGAEGLAVGDTITVTGTIKNYKGTIEFDAGCSLDAVIKAKTDDGATSSNDPADTDVPAATLNAEDLLDMMKVLDLAYALENGESMSAASVLKGTIASIDTEYSEQYGNITVTIVVAGDADRAVQCFRLKGEGAATLAVADEIAVVGTIKNYNGKVEFDAGCLLVSDFASAQAAVAAYALETGAAFSAPSTMTGVITSVDTEYSEQYGNVTVTIVTSGLEDYAVQCFRLKGDGADTIAVGDTITVTGTIKNYNGKIEFDAGCTLDGVVKAN